MQRKPDSRGDYSTDCHFAIMENVNLTIPWYLSTSLAYYQYDVSLISDHIYDAMCKMIGLHWNEIKHRHKHLVDVEAATAGTGFYLREDDLPLIVVSSTKVMVNNYMRKLDTRS